MNNIVIFLLIAIIISLTSSIRQLKTEVDLIKMKLNTISKHVDLPDPTNNELKIIVLELISKGEKIKAYLITGEMVTKENIDKILIESGYYTKEQVYGNN